MYAMMYAMMHCADGNRLRTVYKTDVTWYLLSFEALATQLLYNVRVTMGLRGNVITLTLQTSLLTTPSRYLGATYGIVVGIKTYEASAPQPVSRCRTAVVHMDLPLTSMCHLHHPGS